MNAHEYAFVVVATIGSIAAVAVVTARNVVHAALYLVVTLAAVGITFLLLGAEFVGWVQILIYVGAIVILFLFGLMLTKAPIGRDTLDYQNRAVGAVVSVVVALLAVARQEEFPGGIVSGCASPGERSSRSSRVSVSRATPTPAPPSNTGPASGVTRGNRTCARSTSSTPSSSRR